MRSFKRKMVSWMLVLCMLVTVFPAAAATTETGEESSGEIIRTDSSAPKGSELATAGEGRIAALSLTVEDELFEAEIDHAAQTIVLGLPVCSPVDVTALTPKVALEDDAYAYQPNGAQDFTEPVIYTITDEKGQAYDYTVSLNLLPCGHDAPQNTVFAPMNEPVMPLANEDETAVKLYDMYVGAYTNRLVYMPANPTTEPAVVTFKDGTGYSVVPVDKLANLASMGDEKLDGLKDLNLSSFFNPVGNVKGESNKGADSKGNVVVFHANSPLAGMIMRADSGYVFLCGFPQKTHSTAGNLAKVAVDIGTDTYNFALGLQSNYEVKEWPAAYDYVVSHGYATVRKTSTDFEYALGMGKSAGSAIDKSNLSTFFPGVAAGKLLIFPYMATNYNSNAYYLYVRAADTTGNGTINKTGTIEGVGAYSYATSYTSPFAVGEARKPGTTGLTFPEAGATLSDGGMLNLTLTVGESYTIYSALWRSFPHLRYGTYGGTSYTCVKAEKDDKWATLFENNGVVSYEGTGSVVEAKKAGSTTTQEFIKFTVSNNCAYWQASNGLSFNVKVKITVVGGLTHETSPGGTDVDAEKDSIVRIQRYDQESSTWVTLKLYASEEALKAASQTPGVSAAIVADKKNASYEAGDQSYKVVGEDAKIPITGLAEGYAYRLVKENAGKTDISAFFNVPEQPVITPGVGAGSGNNIGTITVTQGYGAYSSTHKEEYCLEIHDVTDPDNPVWKPVGSDTRSYASAASGEDTLVFTGLDITKTYRVVTRMAQSVIVVTGEESLKDTEKAVGVSPDIESNAILFGDQQKISGPTTLYFEGGSAESIDLSDNYSVNCAKSKSECADSDGYVPGELTFAQTGDANVVTVSESGELTLGTKYGVVDVDITAAGSGDQSTIKYHFAETLEDVKIHVVPPFSTTLVPSGYGEDSITVAPGYNDLRSYDNTITSTDEQKPLLLEEAVIEYRKADGGEWVTVPASEWNWEDGLTLDFDTLTPDTEYELRLTASNKKGTQDASTITFKTPPTGDSSNATGGGSGRVEVTVKVTEESKDEGYTIVLKDGDRIVAVKNQDAADNTTGAVTFDNLAAGDYTVEITHVGSTQTTVATVPPQSNKPAEAGARFDGYVKETAVAYTTPSTTPVTVGGLYNMYDRTSLADDSEKGITQDDLDVIELADAEGEALIKLLVEDVSENDTAQDGNDPRVKAISEIKTVAQNQKLAVLVDLTLHKTIIPNNTIPDDKSTTQLVESNTHLDVTIRTGNINGSSLRVLRVHDADSADRGSDAAVGQVIPTAVWSESKNGYVWGANYAAKDNCNGDDLKKGEDVGNTSEYCVFGETSVTVHVKKFSLYAVAYTPRKSSGGGGGTTIAQGGKDLEVKLPGNSDGSGSSSVTGGTITTNVGNADAGDKVTVTVKPDDGYRLETITVTTKDGKVITLTDAGNDSFTFTMPKEAVSVDVVFGRLTAPPTVTGIDKWFDTEHHIKYIGGYPQGDVRPLNNMTRAEVAQMIFNLMRTQTVTPTNVFSDVPADAWYTQAVLTLAEIDIVAGYPDGSFRPDASITRAEFTTMLVKFTNFASGEVSFSDLSTSHWGYDYIASAAGYGWIGGYDDGTFRPDQSITRAEAVTIVNKMLYRFADRDYINLHEDSLVAFTDLTNSETWYYYDMREATNTHDFEHNETIEVWTSANKG